jgi:hypothetical protein
METAQKPDATKIDVALKRAAQLALYGTREERSGRFLGKNAHQPLRGERHTVERSADQARRKA